jgi:hypothetical protein
MRAVTETGTRRAGFFQVEEEKPAEFVDRLGQLTRAMRARNDAFGLHAAEVGGYGMRFLLVLP